VSLFSPADIFFRISLPTLASLSLQTILPPSFAFWPHAVAHQTRLLVFRFDCPLLTVFSSEPRFQNVLRFPPLSLESIRRCPPFMELGGCLCPPVLSASSDSFLFQPSSCHWPLLFPISPLFTVRCPNLTALAQCLPALMPVAWLSLLSRSPTSRAFSIVLRLLSCSPQKVSFLLQLASA